MVHQLPASKLHESLAVGTTSWHADKESSCTTAFPLFCAVIDFLVDSCDDHLMVCFDDGGDNLDVKNRRIGGKNIYERPDRCRKFVSRAAVRRTAPFSVGSLRVDHINPRWQLRRQINALQTGSQPSFSFLRKK